MDEFFDVIEVLCHSCFTGVTWILAHWEPVFAFILMGMQGVYLYYKIKQKRKECK